jgi:tetratricopeptide (TPR) repeat protein
VGSSYLILSQPELAQVWFHRSLNSGADIIAQGESVHLQSLNRLIEMELPPEEKIGLYNQSLDRFASKVDQGSTYYHLALAYEAAGIYDKAFQAYTRFLDFPDTVIPGKIDEHQRIREMLALAGVNRDWTRENLNQLIVELRTALAEKDSAKVLALQAKVNFFSMSWLQEKADFNSQVAYDLRRFVKDAPHIYTENALEGNSNSQEAYLKTWGWSPYMPIWYLYFRRINFPADPEINGNWEWVGIFFGNSIQ